MKLGYVDGYVYGQHDALTWLSVPAGDDPPLAAFDFRVQSRAAMVCLSHNLAIGAALCMSWRLGYQRGIDDENSFHRGIENDELWRPGCGKPVGEPWTTP